MKTPFENALNQIDKAIVLAEFSQDFLEKIKRPEREIKASLPVRMDDGMTKVFEGYRVQYSGARGPYKGGIRFHHATDIEEVKALAFWMAIKCAISNIPMGGGKGGVTVDPKVLSKTELEGLSRAWVRWFYPVIGPGMDIPAPDVNTTPEIMGWMVDEYEKITGDTTKATFTGKAVSNGGSEGRGPATGMGGFYVFNSLNEKLNLGSNLRIAVQGMGNVGGNAARIFAEHGHIIVAMSDSKGGIFSPDGLDPNAVEMYKKEHGSLSGFPNVQEISNEDLLELDVDVLIPAALENQITDQNAHNIKAKLILELANGPTTPEADDILSERGVVVVPDILANAGGVIVSTFEWEQNLKGERWSEADVLQKLQNTLAPQSVIVWEKAQELKTDLRRAAFVVALKRIEEAEKNRN